MKHCTAGFARLDITPHLGGYEPRNSRFVKGVGELFTDEASKLLNTLQ